MPFLRHLLNAYFFPFVSLILLHYFWIFFYSNDIRLLMYGWKSWNLLLFGLYNDRYVTYVRDSRSVIFDAKAVSQSVTYCSVFSRGGNFRKVKTNLTACCAERNVKFWQLKFKTDSIAKLKILSYYLNSSVQFREITFFY